MVTFDITNLYSNILHQLVKKMISLWIKKYPEILLPTSLKTYLWEYRANSKRKSIFDSTTNITSELKEQLRKLKRH